MLKKPYRKNSEISQTFSDGVVTVYATEDGAKPAERPVVQLREKIKLRYAEQRLGIQRFYSGKQDQVEIRRVIRCPDPGHNRPSPQDIAITEDGVRYRIHMVQGAFDVYPRSLDLTLATITHDYEKAEVVSE